MSIGTMLFNPFTGEPRHPEDIKSDPRGFLVWDGEEPLKAYPKHRDALEVINYRIAVIPTHEAADAFWQYWRENGESHKHGYYESTWGAINRAIRLAGVCAHIYPEHQ